jgi:predicted TIM-barrel enzyme
VAVLSTAVADLRYPGLVELELLAEATAAMEGTTTSVRETARAVAAAAAAADLMEASVVMGRIILQPSRLRAEEGAVIKEPR